MSAAFPASREGRDRFIAARRPEKNASIRPARTASSSRTRPSRPEVAVPVATIFLTNKECTYRCTMCDLWKNTLDAPTPRGAIPEQIRWALERLPAARRIKLYNAGSFFDRAAIPPEDHAAIAELVRGFDRVVVECHPALVGDNVLRFRDLLGGAGARGRDRPRDRARGGAREAQQGDDGRRLRGVHPPSRLARHPRCAASSSWEFLFFERKNGRRRRARASTSRSGRARRSSRSFRRGSATGRWRSCSGPATSRLQRLRDLERALEDFFEGEEGRGGARGMLLADLWNADALPAPAAAPPLASIACAP